MQTAPRRTLDLAPALRDAQNAGMRCLLLGFVLLSTQGCSGSAPPAGECVVTEPIPELSSDEVIDALEGLSFDAFVEASYLQIVGRDPEAVLYAGLGDEIGLPNRYLSDLSDAYAHRTYDVIDAVLAQLVTYDRAALTPAQWLELETYRWYLDDWASDREFLDFSVDILVHVTSNLYYTLVVDHPIASPDDAADYVVRLRQAARQIEQVRVALAARAGRGIVPTRDDIETAREYIQQSFLGLTARDTPFYTDLATRLGEASQIPAWQAAELLAEAEAAIDCGVLPALGDLDADLADLLGSAPPRVGLAARYEGGAALYAHELRFHTTTEMTAEEIHQLGLNELDRLDLEMRERFVALGYPADASIRELFVQLGVDSGFVEADAAVAEAERILDVVDARLGEAFIERPVGELRVIADGGTYYTYVPEEGFGEYHLALRPFPRFEMPTLTHHEGVPGHHLQISVAYQLGLPRYRQGSPFTAYVEGWALYGEQLASELGWYEEDPRGELGRLQAAAWRAARLVVDTGIHHFGWDLDAAAAVMRDRAGLDPDLAYGQASRYLNWPGQATAYWIGMQRILDVRQEAIVRLGADFDLRAFHSMVLRIGAVPLHVLDEAAEESLGAPLALQDHLRVDRTPPSEHAGGRRRRGARPCRACTANVSTSRSGCPWLARARAPVREVKRSRTIECVFRDRVGATGTALGT